MSDMKMPKATDEDKERFRELVALVPGIEVKPMFGQLGGFVNGNMCAGLFAPTIGVKLAAADLEELAALGGGPFGPAERPMNGWLTLPDGVDGAEWVARAAAYISTLPPKAPKTPKKK